MKTWYRTTLVFAMTAFYLLRSYVSKKSVTQLKQMWAVEVLKTLGVKLDIVNAPATENKFIIVANHVGFLDIIILMACEPRCRFLAKSEIANWPIIGSAAKRVGTVFVKRESAQSRSDSKTSLLNQLLAHDKDSDFIIAGFPSGTTCLYEHKPWKKGLFEVAGQSLTPIQPAKISYSSPRVCAYIDEDNLIMCLKRICQTEGLKAQVEWLKVFNVIDPVQDAAKTHELIRASEYSIEKKAYYRSAHSFELQ